jgi:hypothetical protein
MDRYSLMESMGSNRRLRLEPIPQSCVHAGLPARATCAKGGQNVTIKPYGGGFLVAACGASALTAASLDARLHFFVR